MFAILAGTACWLGNAAQRRCAGRPRCRWLAHVQHPWQAAHARARAVALAHRMAAGSLNGRPPPRSALTWTTCLLTYLLTGFQHLRFRSIFLNVTPLARAVVATAVAMRACGGVVLVAAALLGIWLWSSGSDSPQLHVRHAATGFLARRAIASAAERAAGAAAHAATGAFKPRPTLAVAARPAERAAAAVASSLRAAVTMGTGTDVAESPPRPAQRRPPPPPPLPPAPPAGSTAAARRAGVRRRETAAHVGGVGVASAAAAAAAAGSATGTVVGTVASGCFQPSPVAAGK